MKFTVAASLILALLSGNVEAQFTCGGPGQISFAGSTTVFPITNLSATQYNKKCTTTTFSAAAGGSGAGYKAVCAVAGVPATDIGNLSREFKATEATADVDSVYYTCAGGSRVVIKVHAAVDGLTLITKKNGLLWKNCLSNRTQGLTNYEVRWLYSNLSTLETDPTYTANLPYVDGNVATHLWSEVAPWCNKTVTIKLAAPDVGYGTRDFFTSQIFQSGAIETYRSDVQNFPDNSDAMRNWVFNNEWSVGFLGYSYAAFNDQVLQTIPIDGVAPSPSTLQSATYQLFARRIYQMLWNDTTSLAKTKCFSDFLFTPVGKLVVQTEKYLPIPESEWPQMTSRVPGTCAEPGITSAPTYHPTPKSVCYCNWWVHLFGGCCKNNKIKFIAA